MAADFYYNDYAFRNNSSKSLKNERKKIIKKAQKIKTRKNVKSFLAISLLLVLFIVLIYLYGQLMEVNYSLNYSRSKLNTLSIKTEEIQASISSEISTDEIREYADQKLGMIEPHKNQIKYLNVKQADTTVMCVPTNEGKNAFDFLLSFFN